MLNSHNFIVRWTPLDVKSYVHRN